MSEQPHIADVPAAALAARVVREAHQIEAPPPYTAGDRVWHYQADDTAYAGVVTDCRALPTGGWVVDVHSADEGDDWFATVGFDAAGQPFGTWIEPRDP